MTYQIYQNSLETRTPLFMRVFPLLVVLTFWITFAVYFSLKAGCVAAFFVAFGMVITGFTEAYSKYLVTEKGILILTPFQKRRDLIPFHIIREVLVDKPYRAFRYGEVTVEAHGGALRKSFWVSDADAFAAAIRQGMAECNEADATHANQP